MTGETQDAWDEDRELMDDDGREPRDPAREA